jgi:hypothetical protein
LRTAGARSRQAQPPRSPCAAQQQHGRASRAPRNARPSRLSRPGPSRQRYKGLSKGSLRLPKTVTGASCAASSPASRFGAEQATLSLRISHAASTGSLTLSPLLASSCPGSTRPFACFSLGCGPQPPPRSTPIPRPAPRLTQGCEEDKEADHLARLRGQRQGGGGGGGGGGSGQTRALVAVLADAAGGHPLAWEVRLSCRRGTSTHPQPLLPPPPTAGPAHRPLPGGLGLGFRLVWSRFRGMAPA